MALTERIKDWLGGIVRESPVAFVPEQCASAREARSAVERERGDAIPVAVRPPRQPTVRS